MMDARQLLFLVYCLLLVAVGLGASALEPIQVSSQPHAANPNHSHFEEATIDRYDYDGTLVYRLNSPRLRHQKNSGFDFEQPQFVYQPQQGTPLVMIAERGSMADNSDLIMLSGQVNLLNINDDDSEDYLDTSDVTIDLDAGEAYTDQQARLRQTNRMTQGQGMVADLKAKTVSLQSKIRVIQEHPSETKD